MPDTRNPTTEQGQSAAAATREVEQSTTETGSANDDASKVENSTDSGASQGQRTGPGPKVLRSHFRGMPSQWEKNQHPKKDGE